MKRGTEAQAQRDAEQTSLERRDQFIEEGKAPTDAAMEALTMMLPRYRRSAWVLTLSEGEIRLTPDGRLMLNRPFRREGRPILTNEGKPA